jgi:3-oxoacyl-[acyl-carrier protein] reductase
MPSVRTPAGPRLAHTTTRPDRAWRSTAAFGWINTRLTAAKGQENFIEVEGKKVALGIPGTPPSADADAADASAIKRLIVVRARVWNAGAAKTADAVAKTVPLARAGNVDDAAGSVLLLASPHASYITGHCLEVTGGAGI